MKPRSVAMNADSGPMTGLPDHNIPAFDAAEGRLLKQGHFVINPADISAQFGTYEEIAKSFAIHYDIDGARRGLHFGEMIVGQRLAHSVMDADLAAVRSCDAIYLLRGWEKSRGAKKELAEAIPHGLQVMQEDGAVPVEQTEAQKTTTEATCPHGETTNMGCVFCYDGVICSETSEVCPYYSKEEES